jgi:spoIIIJ-associated protein
MVGRRLGQPCRVIVDVTGYRQRRAEQLAELAETLAAEVRETQEPVTLEAMPANERRLVHIALADDDEVRTYSIGEGDERRVVISPKG